METQNSKVVLCPSAQPAMAGSMIFGVVSGTAEQPLVAWIERPVPVTDELLALTGPVPPTQVLRIAAPCQEQACCHFDGTDCRLATRLVKLLPAAVDALRRAASGRLAAGLLKKVGRPASAVHGSSRIA